MQRIRLFHYLFWRNSDLKILQSDSLRPFPLTSQEQDFSQIQDLWMNSTNNANFHYRTNSVKINDQIFP